MKLWRYSKWQLNRRMILPYQTYHHNTVDKSARAKAKTWINCRHTILSKIQVKWLHWLYQQLFRLKKKGKDTFLYNWSGLLLTRTVMLAWVPESMFHGAGEVGIRHVDGQGALQTKLDEFANFTLLRWFLLFINRVCFSYSKILRPRSWSTDRGLNILQYEKQTRLMNSLLDDQKMREGQPTLKSFCELGLKLESCWVTHRPDDVDRFLHL